MLRADPPGHYLMTPRLFILGGTGLAGRAIAEHLLGASNVDITIASRHLDQSQSAADGLNHRFPGRRASAAVAEVREYESLTRALPGHDMVVLASPATADSNTIIQACLDTQVDYIDIQLSADKLACLQSRAGDIEQAGRCFITEAGFHPGLPSALVRLAAAHLDEIERATLGGYINLGRGLPYTQGMDELVELFRSYDMRVYRDGHWVTPGFFETVSIDFAGDIGSRRAFPMFFEELHHLPEMLPSLRELGFYISESHWVTDFLITPTVMAGIRLFPGAHRVIGRWLWWGMTTFHRPPYRVELLVEGMGVRDGVPAVFRASIAHADGYQLTAIPVVATLLQVLDGTARRCGLWMMGHLVDPDRLMRDMGHLGASVVNDEP